MNPSACAACALQPILSIPVVIFLTSWCAECCASDAYLTSFRATLTLRYYFWLKNKKSIERTLPFKSCGLTPLLCVSIWWPTLTSQRFSTFFCSYCCILSVLWCWVTVRSDAEERMFWGARLDVLIFRLRSYHVLRMYSTECDGPKFYKTLMFLGQAAMFLSFQARHSSATHSSTSDLTVSPQHNCDIDLSSFLLFIFYCQQCSGRCLFLFNLISCVALFVIDHGMCMLTERLPAHTVHKSNRDLASFVQRVLPGMSP